MKPIFRMGRNLWPQCSSDRGRWEPGVHQAVVTNAEAARDPAPPNFLYEHIERVFSDPSVFVRAACFFLRGQLTAVGAGPEQK